MPRPALNLYYAVKESFWFVPACMAVAAALSAIASVAFDRQVGADWLRGIALVWSGGGEGARSVLSVIAGSTMTVVSIVFSITITALAQTSSHFGPRVLRNFTRDRRNQFVLGTFVATFLFSLLVLRTVRTEDGSAFVPYVSVNVGIALAVLSLAVLIFFIHHMATSIQADLLVARVGNDCRGVVETMFPRTLGEGAAPDEEPLPAPPEGPADRVSSAAVGYVEAVDEKALFETACQADVLVRVLRRPGDFVGSDQALARVTPAGRLDDDLSHRLREAFNIGARRTPEQDVGYSVQQLVEIAARALSPGVNEPFTAMLCIDWIATAVRTLAGREGPPPLRKDASGVVRVIACPLTFVEIVQMSFGMIRRYAGGAADIYAALLRALRDLEPSLHRNSDREALLAEGPAGQPRRAHGAQPAGPCCRARAGARSAGRSACGSRWDPAMMETVRSAVQPLWIGIVVYLALVVLLRVSGKRTLSKWNAFDFVVTIALGSVLATALVSDELGALQGIVALALLVGLQFAITWSQLRSRTLRHWTKARPRLLLHGGQFDETALREERVTHGEVLAAIRAAGHGEVERVDAVVLETDGSVSVIAQTGRPPWTT